MKGEERAQRNSQTTEIWKGRYNDGAVALKVLKAPREDLQRTKTVSVSRGPWRGSLADFLTDDIAVLQGSGVDEAAQSRQHRPLLRGIDNCLRLLPGISLVRKWKHHGLPEEARCQSIRSGKYI